MNLQIGAPLRAPILLQNREKMCHCVTRFINILYRSGTMNRSYVMFSLLVLSLPSFLWAKAQGHHNISTRSIYQDISPEYSLELIEDKQNIVPIVVIGSGPAGLTAAMYGARAHMHTVVFTGKLPGGQLTFASSVENWSGIKGEKCGYEIMQDLREQAEGFGATVREESIVKINASTWPYELITSENTKIYALSVIIATGSAPRRLGVPNEAKYVGRGVSSCAVCDCIFFKHKHVYVVGSGDTAAEQAMQLAPYAKHITILVRNGRMRAANSIQEKLKGFSNITIEFTKEVVEVIGNGKILTGLKIRDNLTDAIEEVQAQGLFVAIGHNPNTTLFQDVVQMNTAGYIQLQDRSQATSVRGIFAAGDVEDGEYRQAVVASGSGCKAALEAVKFLRDIGMSDIAAKRFVPIYFH